MIPIKRALLIGIDHYQPHQLSDGTRFPNLRGAVNDVELMATWLLEQGGIESLFSLVSPLAPDGTEQLPTYQNMVAMFKAVINESGAGDHVWVHFSGHGVMTPSILPDEKDMGLDEAWVPCDIGARDSGFFRDVELAALLHEARERDVFVTLTLDCCHAGGMARELDPDRPEIPELAAARTTDGLARLDQPITSAVADLPELARIWKLRNERVRSGLPEQGFVLIAACRNYEKAYEYFFDGRGKNGALTYNLTQALRDEDRGPGYYHVFQRVMAKVHDTFPAQTPRLEGEISRHILDLGSSRIRCGLTVLAVRDEGVVINGGRSHGLAPGMRLAVFDCARPFPSRPVALLKLKLEDGVYGLAEPEPDVVSSVVRPGFLVLPQDRGGAVTQVSFEFHDAVRDSVRTQFLEELVAQSCLVGLVEFGEFPTSRFQVVVNQTGFLQCLDRETDLPFLINPICIHIADAAEVTAKCLAHLSWWEHVWHLGGGSSPNGIALDVDATLYVARWDWDHYTFSREAWRVVTPEVEVAEGDNLMLVVANKAGREIHVSVLGMGQDGSVTRFAPGAGLPGDVSLLNGEKIEIKLVAGLPPGATHGFDLFKVLVTTGSGDASWLQLPPLGEDWKGLQDPISCESPDSNTTRAITLWSQGRPWLIKSLGLKTIKKENPI